MMKNNLLEDAKKTVISHELFEQFCEFLVKKTGLHYPKNRWCDLEKKLVHIKHSFGFDDLTECLEWLMNQIIDKEKLDVLTLHLTIGETYFFRDRQLFATLEQQIIPDILRRRQKDRLLRIWSVGCCTGEEPYSIAILLHRLIPDLKKWNVSILGSDINPEFLHKAEKARYKKWSFRTTPPEIQKCYFQPHKDGTYTLIPDVRRMVTFNHINLVEDAYPDLLNGLNEMDLVFCHNVLIYFSEAQIKKTIRQLSETLSEKGWLSVSAIEVPFIAENFLEPHRFPGAVFFKKELTNEIDQSHRNPPITKAPPTFVPKAKTPKKVLSLPPKPPFRPKAPVEVKQSTYEKCHQLYQQNAYQEVIACLEPVLTADPVILSTRLKEVILLILSYANQGDLFPALEWSERALQADKLHPMLHYLHATLLQAQGNLSESMKSVKRALFIDSNFIMAYLLLGILEKQQDNNREALRHFKTASELLDNHSPGIPIPGAEEFTVEYLKNMTATNLKNL